MTDGPAESGLPGSLHRPVLAVALALAVLGTFAIGLTGLPAETAPLPQLARHAMRIALPVWGQTDVVTEVVYGSRGFDTFGETFILLAAVLSVMVLARSREPRATYLGEATAGQREQSEIDPDDATDRHERETRSAEHTEDDEQGEPDPPPPDPDRIALGAPGPEEAEGMTVLVQTAARIAAVFLFVAALYVTAWGYSPGGGFVGGAALTGVAILLYAALGHRRVSSIIRPSVLEPFEIVGAILIVGVGVAGLLRHGSFFANFLPLAQQQTILAGGDEQLYSAAELIEVGTGLTIAVFSLLGLGHDWAPDEDQDEGAEDQ